MPAKISTIKIYSGLADSSGDAVATSGVVKGKILAIVLDYDASSNSNTDVVITAKVGTFAQTVLTITDANTDAIFYPRIGVEDTTGTALVYSANNDVVPTEFPVDGIITVTVDDQTENKAVTAYITMEVF